MHGTSRADVTDAINAAELMALVTELAAEVRISGSEEEARTFDFVERELAALGFTTARESFRSLVGFPLRARVEVLSPERLELAANGYSLSPSTPAGGIVAELLDVGGGSETDYSGVDARGKVVLAEGLGMPGKQLAADRAGAAAQIHVNGERIHEMCLSPVWGTPTADTAGLLPSAPAVAVLGEDGAHLRQLLQQGPVTVRVETETYREWRSIPVLVADLPGSESDSFVLFSGHIDSWHYGAVDNASANAVQLAVARALAARRGELRRGIRLAFWSGHSHARYAGSTWYVDTHWDELEERCVAHVNVDSVGAKGAEVVTEAPTMAETFDLADRIINETIGERLEYRRVMRAGDQSLWGLGVPSLFITLSEQLASGPAAEAAHWAELLGASRRAGGVGPFWHTPEDTLDKIEPAYLERDARVYAATVWELCTAEVLPFSYAAAVREIVVHVRVADEAAGGCVDFSALVSTGERLAGELDRLEQAAAADPDAYNRAVVELGHLLIPVNYVKRGRFDQDLALATSPVPGLSGAARLSQLDSEGAEFRFLLTEVLRQRNRIASAFRAARRIAAQALAATGGTLTSA